MIYQIGVNFQESWRALRCQFVILVIEQKLEKAYNDHLVQLPDQFRADQVKACY